MHRKTKLILLFYRPWAPASILVTALCVLTLARTSITILPFVMLLKVAVQALILYAMREYGARTLCYFTNLGMTPRALWGWSTAFDFMIFALCIATTTACRLP